MKKMFLLIVVILLVQPVFGSIDIFEGPCAGMIDYDCVSYCKNHPELVNECNSFYSDQDWFINNVSSPNEGNTQSKEISVKIEVIPSKIIKPYSTLEKILFHFFFEDGSKVNPENIKSIEVTALGENYNKNDFEIDETENALTLNLKKQFLPKEFVKYMGMGFNQDSYLRINQVEENSGGRLSGGETAKFEFDPDAENFQIVLKQWQNVCFGTQKKVEFSLLSEGETLEEIRTVIFEVDGDFQTECDFLEEKSSDEIYKFSCSVPIPKETETTSTEIMYGILAEARVQGKKQAAIAATNFELSNDLRFEAIYPEKGSSMLPSDSTEASKLKLWIECSESSDPLGVDSIIAEVNGKEVMLIKNEREGYFEAENVFADIGNGESLQVSVSLKEDFLGNYFDYETVFDDKPNDFGFNPEQFNGNQPNEGFPWDIIIIVVVIAVAILTATFFLRKKQDNIEELTEKKKELEGLIKQIEIEFYKRRITDVDYKKRLLEYQEKLRFIDVKLGLKKQK
ncbi:MAG: hypothetical protein V1672_04515 [Candidatus Diapherotrites archaeon]